MAVDTANNLWVAINGGGIAKLSPNGAILYRGQYGKVGGLAVDSGNNAWLACSADGLGLGKAGIIQLDANGAEISRQWPSLYFYTLAIAPDGNLYTDECHDWLDKTSLPDLHHLWGGSAPISNIVTISVDKAGNIWCACGMRGLFKLDSKGNQIARFPGVCNAVAVDAGNNIWIAPSLDGNSGVAKLTPSGELLYSSPMFDSQTQGVSCIAVDQANNVWLGYGSGNGGLCKISNY